MDNEVLSFCSDFGSSLTNRQDDMIEEGWDREDWREYGRIKREESKAKRAANRKSSPDILKAAGYLFESKNDGAHLVVWNPSGASVDFWPGTGLWSARDGKRGRGVRKLIKYLDVTCRNRTEQ